MKIDHRIGPIIERLVRQKIEALIGPQREPWASTEGGRWICQDWLYRSQMIQHGGGALEYMEKWAENLAEKVVGESRHLHLVSVHVIDGALWNRNGWLVQACMVEDCRAAWAGGS